MEQLREIKFSLAEPGFSIMDYDPSDMSVGLEKTKERDGFFHCFGNKLVWDAEKSCWRDQAIAIVEEKISGKVYEVFPETVTFINQD